MDHEVVQWGSLVQSTAALGLSALALGYGLSARRRDRKRYRRDTRRLIDAAIAKEVGPVASRLADHELQLELQLGLMKAAEARQHPRPNLSIARTGGEPDLDAA